MRFIAALCLHKLVREKKGMQGDPEQQVSLRYWLNQESNNIEFLDTLCNSFYGEQSIPVKSVLSESICDFIKLYHWNVFEPLVLHAGFA